MLKKSLLRFAPALRFPCFAWVPARALLARAFAGTIPAFRNPCSTWVPARALLARAFAGTSVHRTLALFRLTHRSLISFRLAPGFFSSQSKKHGFCSAPFFKHLRVRKMCGASVHRASRLPKIVCQEPASRYIVFAGSLNGSNYMQ